MNIVTLILALLIQAPRAVAQITALWNVVKPGVSATDEATVDAAIKAVSDMIDRDVAALDAAAVANGG